MMNDEAYCRMMNDEAYCRGFAKAASVAGVDAVALAKYVAMNKSAYATPASDFALGWLSDNALNMLVPGVGIAADRIGYTAGLLSDEDNENKDVARALIPGVGGYRIGNRIKTQINRELRDIANSNDSKDARPLAHSVAEHFSPITSFLASAGLGAGIGSIVGNSGKSALTGSAVGAGVASIASIIGMIASAIKRRRTKKEQIESDRGSLLMKYLVPGTGIYDYFKRIGRSQGEREESIDANKSKKEKS